MAINYILKQNNSRLCDGKYYPVVACRSTVTTDDLAERISELCTATKADVQAVLTALVSVMTYELQNGNTVLLDDFGYFRINIKASGAKTEDDFSVAKNVKGLMCRFMPVGKKSGTGTGATVSRTFVSGAKLKKANLEATAADESTEDTDTETKEPDTQGGGMSE